MSDAFTSCTPAQCRAQMPYLGSEDRPTTDVSKLELGSVGRGKNFVKVWRGRALYLYFWFDGKTEAIAFEKASKARADNPGSMWATCKPCKHECKDIPSMLPPRERKKVRVITASQINTLGKMCNGAAMCFNRRAVVAKALIRHGFAELAPGTDAGQWWLQITEAGRAEVEKRNG